MFHQLLKRLILMLDPSLKAHMVSSKFQTLMKEQLALFQLETVVCLMSLRLYKVVEYEYVMQPGAGSGGGSQTYNQLTASSLTPRGKEEERHWRRIMTPPPAASCR